ncbi:MAG: pilus assembly protein PilP [Burkholderiaceae bacterium]
MIAALGLSMLAACSPELHEIESWMTSVRENTEPEAGKIAEPKSFQPYRYDLIEATGPFSPEKLAVMQDPMQVRARGGIAPDVSRRRELLEGFPLEQIQMVGSLRNNKVSAALLKVDETVYTARDGTFAGQNYGRITSVDETEIRLRELVQDAAGEWVEREATLRLQETRDETGR